MNVSTGMRRRSMDVEQVAKLGAGGAERHGYCAEEGSRQEEYDRPKIEERTQISFFLYNLP